jgi:hypothetical protein
MTRASSRRRSEPGGRGRAPARALVVSLAGALAAAWLGAGGLARAADNLDLHGRLELQDAGEFSADDSLEAALGAQQRNDSLAALRLTWEPREGPWSLSVHAVLTAEQGPDVRLATAESVLGPAPPATWFDLETRSVASGPAAAAAAIDRLAVSWSGRDVVVRAGRQALSWGSGLVFRPMDPFDPFSPAALDTEWKPGVDMLYVQKLFADGSDLQLVLAPRPERYGAAPTADASSAALHLQTTIAGRRTTWLIARDHGDWVGAVGVNGPLGGATWNLEIVPTAVRGGGTYVSALANISDAMTLFGRNATVFAEYFHNGFGLASGPLDIAGLPAPLSDRLRRGQLYTLRQDYLAAGLMLEVNPLLRLSPTLIVGANDGSVLMLVSAEVSLADNLTLIAGVQAPAGGARSEFGGVPLTPAGPPTVGPPTRVYVQLRRYF